MSTPRLPGKSTKHGRFGRINADGRYGAARYRTYYRSTYIGTFDVLSAAQRAIDALDEQHPERGQVPIDRPNVGSKGRKKNPDGNIRVRYLSSQEARYVASYSGVYIGTFDTIEAAKSAIESQKAREAS